MLLENADDAGIRAGRNLVMLGDELIQYRVATPLGANIWRLSALGRGLRGTEWAMPSHTSGERFVVLDADALTAIPVPPGVAEVRVVASGIGDEPLPPVRIVQAPGQALLPLSPVHIVATHAANGDTLIAWKRRSRSGWRWLDAVDAPLGEDAEAYRLVLQPDVGQSVTLDVMQPLHLYTVAARTTHRNGGALTLSATIRHIGRFGLSRATTLTFPLT
jgi:hypothetical protein